MILQVNIEYTTRAHRTGFYRIMYQRPGDFVPSYWMFNGLWHHREHPDLNPPPAWRFT